MVINPGDSNLNDGSTEAGSSKGERKGDDTVVKPDPDPVAPVTSQADLAGPSNRVLLGAPQVNAGETASVLEEDEYREFRSREEAEFYNWRTALASQTTRDIKPKLEPSPPPPSPPAAE